MTKRYAAIDIGTNTIKVKIAECTSELKTRQLLYRDFPSCLGRNMKGTIIDTNSLEDCYSALNSIKEILKENHVEAFRCIATHALRIAENKKKIVDLFKVSTGITIEVISGEEEVALTIAAVQLDIPDDSPFVCINAGGGSTELGFHLPGGDQLVFFDFGSLNLYMNYFKGQKNIPLAIQRVKQHITQQFHEKVSFSFDSIRQVISLGGSIISGGYLYRKDSSRNFEKLSQQVLPAKALQSIITDLSNLNDSEKSQLPGMDPKRINTLLPGLLIHHTLLSLLKKETITISTRGISDEVIAELSSKIRL